MNQIRSIEVFCETFTDVCPVVGSLTKSRNFTHFTNILFFCSAVVQNACLIAESDFEDGRNFIKSLYEEVIHIPIVSSETLCNAFDQIPKTNPHDLKIALKYFQSLARFVKMRTKNIPSPEAICLLFIAHFLSKDKVLCGQTIEDFLKQLKIPVSYDQVCKLNNKNRISLNCSRIRKELLSSNLPTVSLRKTPVHSSSSTE